MSEKLITVVVPVYKVEPYIDKCLSSLIVPEEQLPLLEVIVVNDGTPDRSADMAREYEKRYPDVFRVIDKENGGHGSAWNRGVKEATGKYLRFLDSDDWFTTSEFSRLIERLKTLDVDVVISNYNRYYVETGETIPHPVYLDKSIDDKTILSKYFEWEKLSWERFHFWGCTYRREMLVKGDIRFMEGVFYDDAILFFAPIIQGKIIHIFNAYIYNYLIGRTGQTVDNRIRKKHIAAWAKTHNQAVEYCANHWDEIECDETSHYLTACLREWIHDTLVKFSYLPYKESKTYTKEWYSYYLQLSKVIPSESLMTHSIKAFLQLPFPFFWTYRRMLTIFAPPRKERA